MGKGILITSAQGGAGKTTVCCRLGQALAARGRKTVLVELACGVRALDFPLGMTEKALYDWSDLLPEMRFDASGAAENELPDGEALKEQLADVCVESDAFPGLFYLPGPALAEKAPDAKALSALIARLKAAADYVLLDLPFFPGEVFEAAEKSAALALLVTAADAAGVRGTALLADALKRCPARLILNRFDPEVFRAGAFEDLDAVIDGVGVRLIGLIPLEKTIAVLGDSGQALSKGSLCRRIFDRIAGRLEGEDLPLCALR